MGGGRLLTENPDEIVSARPVRCTHCQAALAEADHVLHGRYDKIDLPQVAPVVTRVERYAGRCRCCGGTTLAPVPEGLEPGTPFSVGIVALAMYLRFVHAISYQRLSRLLGELFGLKISEGALDAAFRRGKPAFDADVAAILARLRRARVIYSDETGVRIDGRICWNWVFQNSEVVIHVVRSSRGAGVVAEVLDGHRPALWVSDLYSAQLGHAEDWQICLAHQLRDCTYAIEAGDAVFAPRMKALLLRAVVLARRSRSLAPSTRREYHRRLECALDAVMALAPLGPAHQERLRGHAHRAATRAVALLRWRSDRLGQAAVAAGTQHRSPPGRHQQARTQGRQAQGIRRWRCRARPRFHRSRPGPGPDNTLKGVALIPPSLAWFRILQRPLVVVRRQSAFRPAMHIADVTSTVMQPCVLM